MNGPLDALTLPTALKARRSLYQMRRTESASVSQAGGSQAWERATPVWAFELETAPLSAAELAAWRVFFHKLRGGQNTFLAWDKWHETPIAYIGVADPPAMTFDETDKTWDSTSDWTFDETGKPWGAPYLTALDESAGTIDIGGLPSGFVITAGDPAGWFDGMNYRRHIALETLTESSGAISGLSLDPPPRALPGVGGVILPVSLVLYRVPCEMRVDASSVEIPLDHNVNATVRFRAEQIFRKR
jgi:hypothetical protein